MLARLNSDKSLLTLLIDRGMSIKDTVDYTYAVIMPSVQYVA